MTKSTVAKIELAVAVLAAAGTFAAGAFLFGPLGISTAAASQSTIDPQKKAALDNVPVAVDSG